MRSGALHGAYESRPVTRAAHGGDPEEARDLAGGDQDAGSRDKADDHGLSDKAYGGPEPDRRQAELQHSFEQGEQDDELEIARPVLLGRELTELRHRAGRNRGDE